MRFTLAVLLIAATLGLYGCSGRGDFGGSALQRSASRSEALPQSQNASADTKTQQSVSLNQADAANTAAQATERKIIRNANLTVEVTSPTDSQRKIVSIAESHQGFVVTSESTQRNTEDQSKPEITVDLTVRVPANCTSGCAGVQRDLKIIISMGDQFDCILKYRHDIKFIISKM